ncbi:MAG TPA: CoA transferase [Mycobacterium sp.]|nr:CoA transferase [Mycobacterium sp.]
MNAAPRHLSQDQLPALASLLDELGLRGSFGGEATIYGDDPVIRSPHRLATASGTALLAGGVAAAAIRHARTGKTTDLSIDIIHALHHLHPTHFVEQMGYPCNVGAEYVATNGFFPTRDGTYLMIEAGPPYAKLQDGYLRFFDCANSKEALKSRIAEWDAEKLETALADAGLPGCRAFTREDWLEHPQGRALAGKPVVEIEKIADGEPVPFAETTDAPLTGIRVFDFTHVLAGPRSTQTLAEYGADVLHISSPTHPDTLPQHLCVDHGKRCAYLELTDSDDMDVARGLLAGADVFATTYRPTVNERFGLLPAGLAERSERGIVCMTANAYGWDGPWRQRPGFDQNAQVATGFALREGSDGVPAFSPVFYLADLTTGHLAAAGMMVALLRRATEGGSYHVRVSLARSAMWVQDLGLLDPEAIADLARADVHDARITEVDTSFGRVSALSAPLSFSNLAYPAADRLVPYGADEPVWDVLHG